MPQRVKPPKSPTNWKEAAEAMKSAKPAKHEPRESLHDRLNRLEQLLKDKS